MSRRVLLLGGLDPSGGAGITVDATVCALHGCEPLPIALATTIQGRRGFVASEPVREAVWREQLATVCADGAPRVVKLGFVGDAALLAAVDDALRTTCPDVPVVVDPVLSATAGGMATNDELVQAYREHLLPRAALVTPNTPELELLAAGDAARLLATGAGAVLHKGGHGDGEHCVDELWTAGEPPFRFARQRHDCGPVRGTGCALASAIACQLAQRRGVVEACRLAGDWLAALLQGVRPAPSGLPRTLPLGRGRTAT